MAKAIGFLEHPTGRLGNIVLQYMFLKEIGSYTNTPVFHGNLKGSEYFEDFKRTNKFIFYKLPFCKKTQYSKEDIEQYGIEGFCDAIRSKEDIIVLDPPILGYTWSSMFYPADQILKLKEDVRTPYIDYNDCIVIAIHFRGTDFKTWDLNAYYDKEFYIRAIDYCLDRYSEENIKYMLYTDDLYMDAYRSVVKYLSDRNESVFEASPDRNLGQEIYNMSMADTMISSPSTFAIIASLLAREQTVIHKKEWIEYSIKRNDRFWVEMLEKNNYRELVVL